jgi:Na+-transporting NADH:ubiquinone oxidoreductase subunit NqrF
MWARTDDQSGQKLLYDLGVDEGDIMFDDFS